MPGGTPAEMGTPSSSTAARRTPPLPSAARSPPAVAQYVEHPSADRTRNLRDGEFRAQVLDVLRVENGQIVEITAFEPEVFHAFGLPLVL